MTVRWSNHGLRRDILKAAFSDYFGLQGAEADVLVALFDLGPEPSPWQTIALAASSHRPPTRGALWQRISKLRQAMEAEAVDSIEEQGYWGYSLTEVGFRECRLALTDMAGRLSVLGERIEALL